MQKQKHLQNQLQVLLLVDSITASVQIVPAHQIRQGERLVGAVGVPVGRAFRLSPPLMKGHIASFVHLYARYAWKLLSCVLVFPALYVLPLLHTEQACRLRKWVKMPPTIEKTTILW